MIYLYFYESISQDKSIDMIFTFSNIITSKLFMIYNLNVWLKPCSKRILIPIRREYMFIGLTRGVREPSTLIEAAVLPWDIREYVFNLNLNLSPTGSGIKDRALFI
jgi:hypothetical protein